MSAAGVERLTAREKVVETLNTDDLWLEHDVYLYRASKYSGFPFFYPVYRWGDLWSFSPFVLMLKKGTIDLSPEFCRYITTTPGDVTPPWLVIDREIERIGGPPELTRTLRNRKAVIEAMAAAMQTDCSAVEARNTGKTNIVLCGGRDSMNLLLLKWRNPVVGYSADPNFPLVREFVERNRLAIEVRRLEDRDEPSMRSREITEASCLVELTNWRWTAHLSEIANMLNHKAVIWKGQFADAVLTDYWRSYTSSYNARFKYLKRGYRKAARQAPWLLGPLFDTLILADFRRAIWARGAVLQGAHMGFLRSITNCLAVSGYHGKATAGVWLSADFPRVSCGDLRIEIGREIFGRDVWYPSANPSPPLSQFRAGLRNIDRFVEAVGAFGVGVRM